jgi:Aldehyde dehydrogenase family
MRQHVQLTESVQNKEAVGRGMGQKRPITAGNAALLERRDPKIPQLRRARGFCKALLSRGQRANATTFGLGSGVWTKDVSKAHRVAKAPRAGSVWVNCYQAMDPAVPFGGYKMSGYGRESGKQHLEEYLNVKAVWIKTG